MPTVTIGANTGDTYTGEIDCFMRENAATTNQEQAILEVSKMAAGQHRNAMIAFTGLSNIPSGATITAAALNLYLHNWNLGSTLTINMYRLLRNWGETTVTWNTYDGSNNWTTGGALGADTDYDSTLTASASVAPPVAYQSFSSAQLVQDIQDIVNGTNSNYGWLFVRSDAGNDTEYQYFRSSEATQDGNRPYLEVTYTEAGAAVGTKVYIEYNRVVNG